MNFLHFFSRNKIDESVKEAREKTGSILLDVRTPEEYRSGHIPGSRNIPLQDLEQADTVLKDKDAPLYLYCQSGARSSMAAALPRKNVALYITTTFTSPVCPNSIVLINTWGRP